VKNPKVNLPSLDLRVSESLMDCDGVYGNANIQQITTQHEQNKEQVCTVGGIIHY